MQWINDNTEGLREQMADMNVPDFNLGVSAGTDGSLNAQGDIMGQPVFNTGNIDRSNAEQKVNDELNNVRQTYGQAWHAQSGGGLSKDEIIGLGYRYYGGDYSGSLKDNLYFFADQLNQFNPVALVWDGITSYAYGTDRFGNPQSPNNTTVQVAATLFLGGMKVNARDFHRAIKPMILKNSGNFGKVVGRNPDIAIQKGKIILKGNGPYRGKTYETGLDFSDFFD